MVKNLKKRLISALLVCAVNPVVGTPISAMGVNFVEIKGINEAFQTLCGSYEYGGGDSLSFDWLVSAEENGEYLSTGETSENFYVSQGYENKWLKFAVNNGTDTYESEPEKIGAAWGRKSEIDNVNTKFEEVNENTPQQYIFKVDKEEYILLDVTESDTSKFFVMKNKTVGTRQFSVSRTNIFNDMAAFLNNKADVYTYVRTAWTTAATVNYTNSGYIGNSAYTQLADVILDNIDYEHLWKIEERYYTRAEGERAIKAGIVLPSVTETERYCKRIGLYDANGFWYRTPASSSTGGAFSASPVRSSVGRAVETNYDSNLGIRPMFYLDKSFFKDAKIPVSDLGSEVIKDLKKAYTKSDLSGVYSEEELCDIFGYTDSFIITGIKLTDSDSKPLHDISKAREINAELKFVSGDENISGAVYAAVYAGGNNLKAVGKTGIQIKNNSSAAVRVNIKNENPESEDTLRFFAWDDEMKPIAKSYEHDNNFSARLSGIYETKQTICVVVTGSPYLDYSYKWYISDSEDGEYTALENESLPQIVLKSDYAQKWIKAEVSSGAGDFAQTEPRRIGERWQRTSSTYVEGLTAPDKDDTFSIDGQKFILLDTFESEKDRYLVVCEENVTTRVYSGGGGQQPNDMMSWLNGSEFKNAGYLPQAIHRHLDSGAVWKLEPYAHYNGDGTNTVENATVGGISLPAVSEVKKYADKLTMYKTNGWWSRTPLAQENGGDGGCVMASSPDSLHNGRFFPHNTKNSVLGIRPIFYLDRDFFTKEKIDIDNIGRNIREILIRDYEKEEFSAYTEEEREIIINTGFVEAKLENIMDSSGGNIKIPFLANTDKQHTYTFTLTADGNIVNEQSLTINTAQEITEENRVEITGLYETNIPLTVKHEFGAGADIQWYLSDSYIGGYEAVDGAVNESFTPTQSMGGKYLKAAVAYNSQTFESEPVELNERWYGKNQGAPNGLEVDNAEKTAKITSAVFGGETFNDTPRQYIFNIDGQEFILLDTMNDENSRFLVMSKKAIGERTITTNGQIPADIMCWLNNKENLEVSVDGKKEIISGAKDYTESGYLTDSEGFTALPKKITAGINYDAYWKQEPKMWGGDYERVYRAGITIPSVTELERYYSKFGWKDSGTKYTWTRTGHANSGDGEQMLSYNTDWSRGTFYPNYAYNKEKGNKFGIRPIFYLKDDFFLNNVVSLSNVGSAVRSAITDNYTAAELLAAGYDAAEVSKYCGTASGLEGDVYYLSANGLENGIYDMELTVTLDSKRIAHDEKRVCFMPEYKNQFMDFYSTKGYCDSLSSDWAYDYAMKSGVKIMRIGNEWHDIEKEKGVYDFSSLDRRVARFTNDGVELVFLMAYGNSLYSDGIKTGPANKEAIDAFSKCLSAIAERYPQIKYFEVYNEPNLNGFWQPSENHRDYTYLLQVCDREVRRVRPDAKVAGGVLADGGAGWLGNMLSKNAYPYMDVLSFHPYIYWNKNRVDSVYRSKLDGFMNKTFIYGGFKESIITEIGWPSYNESLSHGCSEETQALETTKQFIFAEANGINKIMGYNFINSGYNADNPEHNFGIVTRDGIPKPAYLSNAIMRKMLAGAVFCGEITFGTDDVSHGYLYYKNGKPLMALWKDFPKGASAADIKGSVQLDGEYVTVYDMSGNLTQSGTSVINLESGIVYVEGMSDKWFTKAAAQSYERIVNSRLNTLGLSEYTPRFANVLDKLKAADGAVMSETEAKELFDEQFAIADKITEDYNNGALNISQTTLSSLLDIVYESGIFVADCYMVFADKTNPASIDADNAVKSAKTAIKAKEDTELGGYLPYSNAVSEIADNHLETAQRIEALAEDNPIKSGFIKSRNALGEKLAQLALRLCNIESLTYDDIIIYAPTEEVNLTVGEEGEAIFAVYNYDDMDMNDAKISVTDKDGNILASSSVSTKAGQSTSVVLNLTVPSADVLSGGYGYAYLEHNGKTLRKISVKLIV